MIIYRKVTTKNTVEIVMFGTGRGNKTIENIIEDLIEEKIVDVRRGIDRWNSIRGPIPRRRNTE